MHSGRASALAPTCFGLILVLKAMRSAVDAWFGPVRLVFVLSGAGIGRVGTDSLRRRNYPVSRSGLRTLPDGEFDWGGTSVKR